MRQVPYYYYYVHVALAAFTALLCFTKEMLIFCLEGLTPYCCVHVAS
jgi:hypothetical protein